jgi:hypothetical protein
MQVCRVFETRIKIINQKYSARIQKKQKGLILSIYYQKCKKS